jgi:hypothetical protein
MTTSTMSASQSRQFRDRLSAASSRIASSIVGSTVSLIVGSNTIAHGRVSGMYFEAGKPKIFMGGASYDLCQVLSVSPATLCS